MNWLRAVEDFFADEPPDVPRYDPVHLAAMLVVLMTVIGALFWLLWTLLVFEGGVFAKVGPALSVLLTAKTLKDYGYEGAPYAMGAFEGWAGNVAALVLTAVVIIALHRTYGEAARRHAGR